MSMDMKCGPLEHSSEISWNAWVEFGTNNQQIEQKKHSKIKRDFFEFKANQYSLLTQFYLKMMLHFIISFRHHYGGITDRIEESFKNSLMQDAVLTFATKIFRDRYYIPFTVYSWFSDTLGLQKHHWIAVMLHFFMMDIVSISIIKRCWINIVTH